MFFIFLVPRLGLGRISEGLPARPRQRSRTEFHHVLLLRARTRSTSWALAPHGSRPKICLPQLQKIHCCLPPTFRFLPFLPSLLSNKPPAHHLFLPSPPPQQASWPSLSHTAGQSFMRSVQSGTSASIYSMSDSMPLLPSRPIICRPRSISLALEHPRLSFLIP